MQEDLTSVMIGTVVLEADETTVVRENAEMAEMAEMAAAATVPRLAPEDFQSGFRVVVAEDNSVSGELTVTGRQGAR